jgi:hypothetical protein
LVILDQDFVFQAGKFIILEPKASLFLIYTNIQSVVVLMCYE